MTRLFIILTFNKTKVTTVSFAKTCLPSFDRSYIVNSENIAQGYYFYHIAYNFIFDLLTPKLFKFYHWKALYPVCNNTFLIGVNISGCFSLWLAHKPNRATITSSERKNLNFIRFWLLRTLHYRNHPPMVGWHLFNQPGYSTPTGSIV